MGPVLAKLPSALITDDWNDYCDALVEAVTSIYTNFIPNKDGEVVDGSYTEKSNSIHDKSGNYDIYEYLFRYDWRLDVSETVETLNDYINDAISRSNGKTKVNLVGRCYGGNVVAAYFEKYGYEKVAQCCLYEPTALGTSLCSDLFSGRISIDPDSIEAWLYNNTMFDSESSEIGSLMVSLVSVLNEVKALGLGTKEIERVYQKIGDNVLPRILLGSYGALPSYWAMVSDERYEEAKRFCFAGREEEYAKFIEKIDNTHYNVVNKAEEIFEKARQAGVEVYVISKYNVPFIPVIESSKILADGTVETSGASLGATCADYGKTLSADYINSVKENGLERYISPDNKIDASTCLFPDRTWFIKNIEHDNFASSIDNFMAELFNEKYDINSSETYPQFLRYVPESGEIIPLENGNVNEKEEMANRSHIQIMFDFLTKLIVYLINLIKGKVG